VSDAPKTKKDMRCERKRQLLCPDKMKVVYAPRYAFVQQMIVLCEITPIPYRMRGGMGIGVVGNVSKTPVDAEMR